MNLVVRGTVNGSFPDSGFADGDTRIFPGDRCVWEQIDTVDADSNPTGGYSIDNVSFVGLTHVSGGGTGRYVLLTDAVLGFIGKTGRFVAISN